jgi:hypothetical protein
LSNLTLELAGLRRRRTAGVPQGRQDGAEGLRIVGFAVAAEIESDRIEINDDLGLGIRHRRQRGLDLREIIEQRLQTLPLGFIGQRLGRRVGGNRHPQYRDDLVGRRAQAIAILPLSEMFERLCKTDHSETEPGFIVLRVGGDARRQVGLAGLEMAALQGLPRDIRGDSREGGTGRQPGQSQRQREPTWHGSIPLRRLAHALRRPVHPSAQRPGRCSTTGLRGGRT